MIKVNGLGVSRIPINGKETLRVMKNGEQLWSGTGLPVGYTLLEYIESTGSQYIETNFTPTLNSKIEYDFALTNLVPQYSGIFVSGSNLLFGMNNNFEVFLGSSVDSSLMSTTNRQRVVFDLMNKLVSVDDSTILCNASYNVNTNYSLPIFAMRSTSGIQYHAYMKLYSCKIYDNEELVRDYNPCKNPSGVCGLYDKVNKAFYGSVSSTPFTGA